MNIDEIEARANAATPGPWAVLQFDEDMPATQVKAVSGYGASCDWEHDATFIAAARTDVPALIARVRELEAERDEARAEVERLRELLDENAYERGLLARRLTEAQTRRDEAYRRGAEAMREACASRLAVGAFALSPEDAAKVVLSTNIPEDS